MMNDAERSDWLAWRREGIGASDVWPIVSGRSTRVWLDKLGVLPLDDDIEDPDDPRVRGRDLEEALISMFERRRPELYVVGRNRRFEHHRHPQYRCTTDGILFESAAAAMGAGNAVAGLEVKSRLWDRPYETLPASIQTQNLYSMMVTGLRSWMTGILFARGFRIYPQTYHHGDALLLANRVVRFWHRNVVGGEAPDIDDSEDTAEAIRTAWPKEIADTAVELDRDLLSVLDRLVRVRAHKHRIEKIEKGLANRVKVALGEAEYGTIDGEPVVSWRGSEVGEYTVQSHYKRTLRVQKGSR